LENPLPKVVILGSGPAGLTAALYTSRAMLEPVVYEGLAPGGQLTTTTDVDNYPGFAAGIMGPELIDAMRAQAERFGTKFEYASVVQADLSERPFKLTFDTGEAVLADTVIVATGATAKWLDIPNGERLKNHGYSACATCDGFFFQGQHIAVVGGGDTAMEEATFLTKFASKVSIIHRRDTLRASKTMQQRAFENPKIEFIWNSAVEDLLGEHRVSGILVRNLVTNEVTTLPATGLFMGIGHQPNTDVFAGQLDTDESGYLKVQPGSSCTNIPGVFAAGDVHDPVYRQAITAAGSGCMAAIDAERFLAGH